MILELNISFELTRDKGKLVYPQAIGLGIFCLLPRMMLIQKDIMGYKK